MGKVGKNSAGGLNLVIFAIYGCPDLSGIILPIFGAMAQWGKIQKFSGKLFFDLECIG